MTAAAILLPNYIFAPEYLRHVVERVPEDYDVDSVDVVCNKDLAPLIQAMNIPTLGSVIVGEEGSHLPHEMVFRMTSLQSSDLKIQAKRMGDPLPPVRVNAGSEHLDIDIHGRTVPRNKKQWEMLNEKDHSMFQRYWPNYEPFRGVISYFPFFTSWINPAEVGVGPRARHAMSSLCFRYRKGEVDNRTSDDEFIVLIYGGSVAYSIFNSLAQSMGKQLEDQIKATFQETGDTRPVRVVNLALPGFTISDILSVHALHGYRYKPDVVIAHLGFNEIGAVRCADPSLLASGLFASGKQADLLGGMHGLRTGGKPKSLQRVYRNDLLPHMELVAEKLSYFTSIVRAGGAKVIMGVQPSLFNKGKLHPLERDFVKSFLYARPDSDQDAAAYMDGFDWLESKLSGSKEAGDTVVCFNDLIRQADDGRWLFWDHAHMNPDGDRLMADHYMTALKGVLQ